MDGIRHGLTVTVYFLFRKEKAEKNLLLDATKVFRE